MPGSRAQIVKLAIEQALNDTLIHRSEHASRVRFLGGFMRAFTFVFALTLISSLSASAQTNQEKQRAQEVLAQVRSALSGEATLKSIHGLSLTGTQRRFTPGREVKGEIKIEWLIPDKFLKSEKVNLQPNGTLTLLQTMNGAQVWVDQQINKPSLHEDGLAPMGGSQSSTPVQVTTSTMGIRDVSSGATTVRNTPPGATTSERTVLGMSLPTAKGGQERDTNLEKMSEETRTARQTPVRAGNKPPSLETPDIKAALERQLRKEFLCLALSWLQTSPASSPLEFSYGGVIKAEQGNIEAIEVSGSDGFAARLFVDQTTHRPVLISYPDWVDRKAGYVVSTAPATPADVQEVAVQLYFSDYRSVQGVWFPFLITKAINGVIVDEWRVEKYKLNPDLKQKRFEKK